jgi:hypothetical protein
MIRTHTQAPKKRISDTVFPRSHFSEHLFSTRGYHKHHVYQTYPDKTAGRPEEKKQELEQKPKNKQTIFHGTQNKNLAVA